MAISISRSILGHCRAQAWLAPLKFVGMAILLSGIGLALATIVRILRWQSIRLWDMLSQTQGNDQG